VARESAGLTLFVRQHCACPPASGPMKLRQFCRFCGSRRRDQALSAGNSVQLRREISAALKFVPIASTYVPRCTASRPCSSLVSDLLTALCTLHVRQETLRVLSAPCGRIGRRYSSPSPMRHKMADGLRKYEPCRSSPPPLHPLVLDSSRGIEWTDGRTDGREESCGISFDSNLMPACSSCMWTRLTKMKGIPCWAPLFVIFFVVTRVLKNIVFLCHSGTICEFVRIQVSSICSPVTILI
jgi:hypothetical protein